MSAALAAFAPSFEIDTQLLYPVGANLPAALSASAIPCQSLASIAGVMFFFIHPWSGQSGSGFFPQAIPPSPATVAVGVVLALGTAVALRSALGSTAAEVVALGSGIIALADVAGSVFAPS
jgi:hypothetical protein